MARNQTYIEAPPHEVFDLLADPRSYSYWVVGSRKIRAADPHWPEPGTRFDHQVGLPPLVLADHTQVVKSVPPVRLELRARARPLPSAHITMHLQPERDGTRVTMIEDMANPALNVLAGPLGHATIHLRNRESLRRLRALAEGRTPRPGGTLPPRD